MVWMKESSKRIIEVIRGIPEGQVMSYGEVARRAGLAVPPAQLPQITALGASLVAISPQLPDESLTTTEKNELAFPALSDVGNAVARQFGLVFALSEHLRPIYTKLGADLPKFNGTDTFELPVPGTFVVDREAVIRIAHVNADYKQRMEPAHILDALGALEV
jgi:peroxiredoxin